VVAYDCDGAREVCIDNQTGFLLRPSDTNSLVDKLSLLADNAALRERFGKFGQEFVRKNFSVEHMVNELESLYLKLASDRRNGQHD
jgi:glycosyltransferase involved in cell wall biosynthesis